jgi:hypothetical protein
LRRQARLEEIEQDDIGRDPEQNRQQQRPVADQQPRGVAAFVAFVDQV